MWVKRVRPPWIHEKTMKQQEHQLSHLPNELLVKIFSYLTIYDLAKRICLVSSRFRDFSYAPSLWTKLPNSINYNNSNMDKLITRCKMLKTLCLSQHSPIPLAIKALDICKQLKVLLIKDLQVNDDLLALLEAVGQAKSLIDLQLNGEWEHSTLTKNVKFLGRLTVLELFTDTILDGGCLVNIGNHCQNITKFTLMISPGDSNYKTFSDTAAMVEFLDTIKGTIQVLTIGYTNFSDVTTFDGLGKCKNLRSITLGTMAPLSLDSLSQLPELKHLSLLIADSVAGLLAMKELHYLDHLELWGDGVDDVLMFTLASSCPRLTQLTVGCCSQITDLGMFAVLWHCVMLSRLELKFVVGITSMAFIDAEGLALSYSLQQLVVKGCYMDVGELVKIVVVMPGLEVYYTTQWV